jgi:putative PEP-CTERM system TPR-repeat lipoprotein
MVVAAPDALKVWQQNPEEAEPAALLGKTLLRRGNAVRALQVIREAASSSPRDTAVLRVLGTAQAETGDYRSAVNSYQRLIAQQPESAPNHYLLAQAYYRNGDGKNFAVALEKAYQLDPTNLDIRIAMLGLMMQRQQWDQARELVVKLKQDHPRNPEVHVQDAQLSSALNEPKQAVEAYQQALALAPERNDLVVKYGLALWQAGQREQAFKPMEDWLDKHPNDGVVRYNLANLYLLADRKPEAQKAFINILDSNPDHIVALNNLAWLLRDTEPKKAVAYAEQAYKLSPTAPVQGTLAMILLAQPGQEARAVRLLENAVQQAPGNTEIHFHLAQALAQSGDKQRATQVLTELLNSKAAFPGKQQAQKLLDELNG